MTAVQRIMPGPEGTSSADAGMLDSVQAAANATSDKERGFMFALSE
jgi:hypothetical protein